MGSLKGPGTHLEMIIRLVLVSIGKTLVFALACVLTAGLFYPLYSASTQEPLLAMESGAFGMPFVFAGNLLFSGVLVVFAAPKRLRAWIQGFSLRVLGGAACVVAFAGVTLSILVKSSLQSEGYTFPGIGEYVLSRTASEAFRSATPPGASITQLHYAVGLTGTGHGPIPKGARVGPVSATLAWRPGSPGTPKETWVYFYKNPAGKWTYVLRLGAADAQP